VLTGASLQLFWCDKTDASMTFQQSGDGTVRPTADTNLCITNVANYTIALEPCGAAAQSVQTWTYTQYTLQQSGMPFCCFQWCGVVCLSHDVCDVACLSLLCS
jgi:hypothetical protein